MDWWIKSFAKTVVPGLIAVFSVDAASDERGAEVAVVYNSNMAPDSRIVAEYYAEKRRVPKSQVIGLPMPRAETITRAEFRTQILEPLIRELEALDLINFYGIIVRSTSDRPGTVLWRPVSAKIRYLVLAYGVPLRIAHDESIAPSTAEDLSPDQRRTEASVDSELAFLPRAKNQIRLHGPQGNPFFGATNASLLHPTNGVLIVARLDGPGPGVARRLVDKALEAETNGLWGFAYFDLRGLQNSPYKKGDDWLRSAAEVAKAQGFPSVIDERPETFQSWFPMPHIALYAGWYNNTPSGPFTRPEVEFMPGAFAYHIYSYSATTVRTPSTWAGLLLDKGVTATVGYVYEPYLDATMQPGLFMSRWLNDGWTFGEAALASQRALSWQTTVIGDPLYRPTLHTVQQYRDNLQAHNSHLLEWAELRLLNLAEQAGTPRKTLIQRLSKNPILSKSPLLEWRLAELYTAEGEATQSVKAMERALKLKPSPQMRRQLQLALGRSLAALNKNAEAVQYYEHLAASETDPQSRLAILEEALPIARKAGVTAVVNRFEREIANLKQLLATQERTTH